MTKAIRACPFASKRLGKAILRDLSEKPCPLAVTQNHHSSLPLKEYLGECKHDSRRGISREAAKHHEPEGKLDISLHQSQALWGQRFAMSTHMTVHARLSLPF